MSSRITNEALATKIDMTYDTVKELSHKFDNLQDSFFELKQQVAKNTVKINDGNSSVVDKKLLAIITILATALSSIINGVFGKVI